MTCSNCSGPAVAEVVIPRNGKRALRLEVVAPRSGKNGSGGRFWPGKARLAARGRDHHPVQQRRQCARARKILAPLCSLTSWRSTRSNRRGAGAPAIIPSSLSLCPTPPNGIGEAVSPLRLVAAAGRLRARRSTGGSRMHLSRPEARSSGSARKRDRAWSRGDAWRVHVTASEDAVSWARARVRRHFPTEKAPLFRNRKMRFRAEHLNRARNEGCVGWCDRSRSISRGGTQWAWRR